MTLNLDKTYTSDDVVQLTGITYRQLQWWDEKHFVRAHRDGHRRIYSPVQVLEIKVMSDLRKRGYSLKRAVWILRKFSKLYLAYVLKLENEYDFHLVTDGSSVHLVSDPKVFMHLLARSTLKKPMTSVPIAEHLTVKMSSNLTALAL